MSQAFYTSASGISASQTQINVVADNIANLNTTGYKESIVTFQDIFYTTQSSGTGSKATTENGGTNPRQIGMGVQIGSIDRNFNQGTVLTTSRALDMNIQGNGFFCVETSSGETLYTRAGSFTVDGAGNMVTPNGDRLIGAESPFSITCGESPIKIPPMIITETSANDDAVIATKTLDELYNFQLTKGDFYIDYYVNDTSDPTKSGWQLPSKRVDLNDVNTISDIVTAIDTAMAGANVTANLSDGKLIFTMGTSGSKQTTQLKFTSGSSNFVAASEIAEAEKTPVPGTNGTYSTKILDYKQTIMPPDVVADAVSKSNIAVGQDGVIEITYSNGDKLSVDQNAEGKNIYKYTTADNIVVKGNDVKMNENVMTSPNLQIQLANFINPNGLVATGTNTYTIGPNVGNITYGTPDSGSLGSLKTGCLEGSNVDLSKQFTDMITAQRAIESNSRVFSTANQIMSTLVYMGQ